MALIKQVQLSTGFTAQYWRIIQIDSNMDRGDNVVTLACHKDEAARLAGYRPVEAYLRFNFCPGDHPLTEFDPDLVNTADVDDFRDVELHVRYLHIKAILAEAKAKLAADPEAKLTENEISAMQMDGCTDA